jgi:hypothetical protein
MRRAAGALMALLSPISDRATPRPMSHGSACHLSVE